MWKKQYFTVVGIAFLFTLHAHASVWPDACGKDEVQFKVKTAKKQPVPAVEAGKAQLVFIEALNGDFPVSPTTRLAIDGAWVGANRGVSYLAVSVAPGTHHFCASRQTSIKAEKDSVGIATLNLEAGKTYFYEFTIVRSEVGAASFQGGAMLPGQYPGSMTAKPKDTIDSASLVQLSEEEGKARLKDAPLSASTPK